MELDQLGRAGQHESRENILQVGWQCARLRVASIAEEASRERADERAYDRSDGLTRADVEVDVDENRERQCPRAVAHVPEACRERYAPELNHGCAKAV